MKDSFIVLAPAKINLFLKILNKRADNYHNIRSGITFINLFDEIKVEKSSFFKITYIGKFAPKNNFYTDCILERLFEIFQINKPRLNFIIEKNITTNDKIFFIKFLFVGVSVPIIHEFNSGFFFK